jgi:hypothetical protein
MIHNDATYQEQRPTLDTTKVQGLLDRYMAGQTTPDEERLLAAWFRSHEVPEAWLPYREMFAWLDAGMPPTEGILDGHEAAPAAQEPAVSGSRPKVRTVRLSHWWVGVAAAAAVAALVWMAWPRQQAAPNGAPTYVAQADSTVETAPATTKTADSTVQTQPQKIDSVLEKKPGGMREYRRFHRSLVLPESYLATRDVASSHVDETHRVQAQADSIIQAAQREIESEMFMQHLYAVALDHSVNSRITEQQTAYDNVLTEDEEDSRIRSN